MVRSDRDIAVQDVQTSRRGFLRAALVTMASYAAASCTSGRPGGGSTSPPLDIGAALITLRNALAEDFDGTLQALRSTGISRVEMAGVLEVPAEALRKRFSAAGLECIAVHCVFAAMDHDLIAASCDYCAALEASYIVAPLPSPMHPPAGATSIVAQAMSAFSGLTPDDWKWNAERFNEIGQRARSSGLKLAYHNHNLEFVLVSGVVPFDDLLRLMDPDLVTIELDVGNMLVGGGDPIHYLEHHPGRFDLAHLKEWAAGPIAITSRAEFPSYAAAFGRGDVDWPRLIGAARRSGVRTFFLEQEPVEGADPMDVVRQGERFFARL